MIKFKSLNQSKEFLRILRKRRINNKYFTIYFEKNPKNKSNNKYLHISFVMKKNIGNAVIRNKIKRKLKAVIQKITMEKGQINLNYTYVIIGKNAVYKDKFTTILKEVSEIFKKINRQIAET